MLPQLHLLSTGEQTVKQLIEKIDKVHPEIDFIHLREKNWTDRQIYDAVMQLIETGVPREKVIINSAAKVANEVGVKGVHLPSNRSDIAMVKRMYPTLSVGSSVHSLEEAITSENEGADFIMYGHIFPSNSKPGKPPIGVNALKVVIEHVNVPVIAIGGITPSVTRSVLKTGAGGIAVLSGILKAQDVELAVRQYKQVMEG